MAIVEMQKVALLAVRDDRDRILRMLQRLGCSEIREIEMEGAEDFRALPDSKSPDSEQTLSRLQWAIGQVGKVSAVKKGFLSGFAGKKSVSREDVGRILQQEDQLLSVIEQAEDCERRKGQLHTHQARIQAAREQLLPWEALDIPLEKISKSSKTSVELMTVPVKQQQFLEGEIAKLNDMAAAQVISADRSMAYMLLISHVSAAQEMARALKAAEAAKASLPAVQGTVRENLQSLAEQAKELEKQRGQITEQMRALAIHLDDLKVLHDICQAKGMREKAVSRLLQTERAFYMEGWVPAVHASLLSVKLKEASASCAIEISDPAEGEKPPTLLKNGPVATQFESVVDGFSLPDPKGLDPTFIMMPFFACFFGMMVSDAGYGLLLSILIPVIIHLIKPKGGGRKLMWILAIGGIFTVLWGFLLNTWFGTSPWPVFLNPMEQPLEMMALCLGLGVVHLFTAMGVAAYMNIKRGNVFAALVDQFSWLALLCGLGLMVLPPVALLGQIMAAAGFLAILFFGGRDKPTFFKRILSGLGKLYGVSGWLGDILSYSRLFGMGLATGVIGMVINMLAGMVMGGGPIGIFFGILVLIGGHGFNMAINVLGAYVHACRLQYIEFFNKFYEDGGVPFKPLHGQTRYVNLSQSDT